MTPSSIRSVRRMLQPALAALVLGSLLVSCASGQESAGDDGKATGPRTEVKVEPIRAALKITDAQDVTVSLDRKPERIVCLVAICDDILTELGVTPTATNSQVLSHPDFLGGKKAAKVPVVPGGFIAPEAEAILSHKPDLVIGLSDTHGKLAPALKGATTFWPVQPDEWRDSVRYLRDLAALTGRTKEGEKAERAFREKLAAAEEKPSEKTSLIIFGGDENFGVATPGTDVAAGMFPKISRYPWKSRGVEGSYSLEEILAAEVDVLFVETLSFGEGDGSLSAKLAKNPLWSKLPAVRNGDVHEVNSEVWAKGRGTRSLGVVLDEATAALR